MQKCDAAALTNLARLSVVDTGSCNNNSDVSISGVFGCLSPELLNMVAAALLHDRPLYFESARTQKMANANSFLSFLHTCRGVYQSISRANVVEMICHSNISAIPSIDLMRSEFPYTLQAKLKIRAALEIRAVLRAMCWGTLHCVEDAPMLAALNREFETTGFMCKCKKLCEENDSLGKAAIGACRCLRLSIVSPSNSTILCTAADGVIIEDGKYVRLVGVKLAEVFTPGREHITTFTTPVGVDFHTEGGEKIRGTFAAEEGGMIAVVTRGSSFNNVYTVKTWTNHGRDLLSVHHLEYVRKAGGTQSMHVGECRGVWVRNGTVSLAFLNRNKSAKSDGTLQVVYISPCEREPVWVYPMGNTEELILSTVSASGNLGIMDLRDEGRETLWFFDMDTRRAEFVVYLSVDPTVSIPGWCNEVAISPDGSTIVVLIRCFPHSVNLRIYKRSCQCPRYYFRERLWLSYNMFIINDDDVGGWKMTNEWSVTEWVMDALFGTITSSTFSSCGDKVLFFLRDINDNINTQMTDGVVVVDVCVRQSDYRSENTDNTRSSTCIRTPPHTMPTQLLCSSGTFMRTGEGGGVMRLGFV
tara:strand:- start:222 stop:1979 length:1758 start_codon:yes stop_codon:yes gene_type:complete